MSSLFTTPSGSSAQIQAVSTPTTPLTVSSRLRTLTLGSAFTTSPVTARRRQVRFQDRPVVVGEGGEEGADVQAESKSPNVEWRISGLQTPGSAYSDFEAFICVDQTPPFPVNSIPRRLYIVLTEMDTVRRNLWVAFAVACNLHSFGPVSRRIAAALGEASLPGTPIDTVTENWVVSQENILRETKDEIEHLQIVLFQYANARQFVAAHGHFDRTIPMCGQAHVDALMEKLVVIAWERDQVEKAKQEMEAMRARKRIERSKRYTEWEQDAAMELALQLERQQQRQAV